jgi:EAL domain-containing protein (putative c-di-GMP-specific phosphodiesterase class I)
MQNLNKLPASKLKSDRFIAPEISIVKTDEEISHSKGSVARALSICVTADEVETEAQ